VLKGKYRKINPKRTAQGLINDEVREIYDLFNEGADKIRRIQTFTATTLAKDDINYVRFINHENQKITCLIFFVTPSLFLPSILKIFLFTIFTPGRFVTFFVIT